MARWDNLWRDEAYVARNWLDPDPHIVRLTPIMQGRRVQRVLDLGCGVGRHLLYLARQGFEGHALDISPYPDAFFDWALSVQVIHHTTAATLRQVIHHVHHKLKPGGFFFVTFPPVENASANDGQEIEPRTFQREEDGEPLLHHYVTAEEIDALMEGFRLLEKRLEPHESRDQFGQTTSKPRWNVLAQKPS